MNDITITGYTNAYASELLRLLLLLQDTYFHKIASLPLQELRADKDIKRSYQNYIELLHKNDQGNWKVFLAITPDNKAIGFIIGSITKDDELVKSNIGIIEDWFVEDEYRAKGAGTALYNKLEEWFKEKDCHQLISDTWPGNEPGIKAHQQLGFFITGIKFGKKLQ